WARTASPGLPAPAGRSWACSVKPRGRPDDAMKTFANESVVPFGEEWDLPVADVDAARRHGWAVARPDAYPPAFHKERGLSSRPLPAWELALLEGCLRAVPDFVSRRRQDDPAREEFTVPAASGPLSLVLSWVVEDG